MIFLGQASRFGVKGTFRHLFASGNLTDVEELEGHLAERYGVDASKVVLYHTGRTALSQAIKYAIEGEFTDEIAKKRKKRGLNLREKGTPEVVITSLTCYAVVQAVRAAGATPVFADVDPRTLHFNGETLSKVLRFHKNVRAVVVQNNLGYPCDLQEIEKITNRFDIPIIEDLAHCAGLRYEDGREAGTVGVAAALSFGKGKSIDTTSGGALVIRGDIVKNTTGNAISSVKTSKKAKKDTTSSVEIDFASPYEPIYPPEKTPTKDSLKDRFYPFFAMFIRALYRVNLGKALTATLLKLHFIERGADAPLNPHQNITAWQARLALNQFDSLPDNRPPLRNFYFVKDPEETLKTLENRGFILNDTWYNSPVAPKRYFEKSGFREEDCPVATVLSRHIINLPTWYKPSEIAPALEIIKGDEISLKTLIKEVKL